MTTACMVREANVKVTQVVDEHGKTCASIAVNDQFNHVFAQSSRVSNALRLSQSVSALEEHLTGGDYFFVDDKLIDFRDNTYMGYVHSDDSINMLMETIGYDTINNRRKRTLSLTTQSSEIALVKQWSKENFQVPGLGEGGNFDSKLLYTWNPFFHYVKGIFEIERLICTNGMVASTPLLNTKVPLINRWTEHLEIANRQIQNKVEHLVLRRLEQMQTQRASVAMLLRIQQHADTRAEDCYSPTERERLTTIGRVANPALFLEGTYTDEVFSNKNLSAHLAGHLTQFDAWNLATEMLSHTTGTEKSTTGAVQIVANSLMFPKVEAGRRMPKSIDGSNIPLSPFSDSERAFFGYQQV
jgi:hypothetical protein